MFGFLKTEIQRLNDALDCAISEAVPEDIIIVSGSLYTISEVIHRREKSTLNTSYNKPAKGI